MASDEQLIEDMGAAKRDAAAWQAVFDRCSKEFDRNVLIGFPVVIGGLFAALYIAGRLGPVYAMVAGAAWMGGIWWIVHTERAILKERTEALEKAQAAASRASAIRREIEGGKYLRREGRP